MKLMWVLDYDLTALRNIRPVDVNGYPLDADECSIT